MELTTPKRLSRTWPRHLAEVLLAIHGGGGVDGDAAREHLRAVLGEGDREVLTQETHLLGGLLVQVTSLLGAELRDRGKRAFVPRTERVDSDGEEG